MPLLDQLQTDIIAAMKARASSSNAELRLGALRMIKTALQKAHVDSPKPLDEADEQAVLKILVKQRIDAAEMFRKGGREEQAQKEEAEKVIVEGYLPAAATDDDMNAAVTAAIAETGAASAKQMGLVMKAAQARLTGKTIDGKLLSEKVKARLS
jgi:uncharacterized protein YqeY